MAIIADSTIDARELERDFVDAGHTPGDARRLARRVVDGWINPGWARAVPANAPPAGQLALPFNRPALADRGGDSAKFINGFSGPGLG
jgi:hypothetical protein